MNGTGKQMRLQTKNISLVMAKKDESGKMPIEGAEVAKGRRMFFLQAELCPDCIVIGAA